MVDNGMGKHHPLQTLMSIIDFGPFKLSSIVIQGFEQSKQSPPRKISIKPCLSKMEDFVDFLVIKCQYWFKALLGRPYMHENALELSTFY